MGGRASLIAIIGVFAISQGAQAGDSGCGLGSVVISKNSKLLQLFSMTTNATFISQAFGITSGTSGCSSSGLVQNDKAIEYFAEANRDDLAREMAQGEGEKLDVLASLHGCRDVAAKSAFRRTAQRSLPKIMPSADAKPQAMMSALREELARDAEAANGCAAVASTSASSNNI